MEHPELESLNENTHENGRIQVRKRRQTKRR